MNFDLSKYETVKERKKRFYNDYPDGRIIVDHISINPLEYALFKATIYTDKTDVIKSTGYAMEIRDKELSKNKYGKEYESVNYSSWTENAEESSVGRALDNAGYSGNDKCSREEIEKSQRMNETIKKQSNPIYELAYNTIATWIKNDIIKTTDVSNKIKSITGRELLLKELNNEQIESVVRELKKDIDNNTIDKTIQDNFDNFNEIKFKE